MNTAGQAQLKPISVAIVDDSAVVRGLFARWLGETADINVVGIFGSGTDALKHIGFIRPDVVLLDLAMPQMEGLQLIPLLQQLMPEAKILVVSNTSQAGSDAALRCLMRGATSYLAKPNALDPERGAERFRLELLDSIRSIAA